MFTLGYFFEMYNRAEIIDSNFAQFVKSRKLPGARSHTTPHQAQLSAAAFMDLFESQLMSRHLDLRARILKNENLCYYTIGSSGHEGNAAIGKAFRKTDMAFLHYRSGALMMQRSKHLAGSTPLYDTMLSFLAAKEDPIAGGRHKVWGSKPLFVPPQTSTIASHLPKAVGAALSIGRARDLKLPSLMPADSVILCSFGDASINHASALSAINTASWLSYQNIPLPLVFVCEDNGIGISVSTPQNWVEATYSQKPGLAYIACDGLNLADTYAAACEAERFARSRKKPVLLHMHCVRLMGHAGSDMEMSYRRLEEIEDDEFSDPLLHSARIILENNFATEGQIIELYQKISQQVAHIASYALTRPKIEDPKDIGKTIVSNQEHRRAPSPPTMDALKQVLGKEAVKLEQPLHMAKLINMGLHETLLRYPNTLLFGEDVAQKGGVYNVTDGLYKAFGSRRVFNSPLDETNILGTAIGFAHNGFVPIPEIQFLAYLHNAEDQLRGEASTLAFFSQGQFTNPMVVRIAGLAYQKGFGGHFHNDNSLAVLRDIPGIIIAVPSNGADAVKMMRACVREAHENGRVVVFVEPIALYMTRDLHEPKDNGWAMTYPKIGEEIAIGQFGVSGEGRDLAIITYGNGYYYSLQAARELQRKHKVNSKVIDLRWIAPIQTDLLIKEIQDSKNILIVEECRKTGSLSEYLVAALVELWPNHPPVRVVAAEDCFIPLGKAAAAGLPKKEEILYGAERLMNLL